MSSTIKPGSPLYQHKLTLKLRDDGLISSCVSCKKFLLEERVCDLWGQQPPLHVVVVGCEEWDPQPT